MRWPIPEWRREQWRETMALVRSGLPIRLAPARPGTAHTERRPSTDARADLADWMQVSEAKQRTRPDGSLYRASAQYTYWG